MHVPTEQAMSVTASLFKHHKHCDDIFAGAEEACADGDWVAGAAAFGRFRSELESHFASEEELLFPAFEHATGMTAGPTAVMRGEHEQMRALLGQMADAVAAHDADTFGGAAETLLILMQQHNMKEENILYPMCDQALGADGELQSRIAAGLSA